MGVQDGELAASQVEEGACACVHAGAEHRSSRIAQPLGDAMLGRPLLERFAFGRASGAARGARRPTSLGERLHHERQIAHLRRTRPQQERLVVQRVPQLGEAGRVVLFGERQEKLALPAVQQRQKLHERHFEQRFVPVEEQLEGSLQRVDLVHVRGESTCLHFACALG